MQLDRKTVRIFAYSSIREQSKKRPRARLKTDNETGERRQKYLFFLSPVRLTRFARMRLLLYYYATLN